MVGEEVGASLVEAAAAGTLERLQELLATTNADVNAQDDKSDTALHAACANGHVGVVRWLLDNGGRVDVRTKNGDSVLHAAVSSGDVALVEMLLTAGFEAVNAQNEDGWTPVHVAVKAGSMEILRTLVEKGADLTLTATIRDGDAVYDECSFLHVAASVDNVDAIKFLVKEKGGEVDFRNKSERTALHQAAASGSIGAVRELLTSGAELDARDEKEETPLFQAAQGGHRSVVEHLLDEGANVNNAREDRWMALHGAASSGDVDTITLLVDRGAKVDSLDKERLSMLHIAAQHGMLNAVKYFLDSGLQIDAEDMHLRTPLFLAVDGRHSAVVELLLDAGANTSAPANDGYGPLHSAAMSGKVETIKLLVEHGADVHSVTRGGLSVLHFACLSRSKEAVGYLLANGLKAAVHDIDSAAPRGYSALHFAAQAGDIGTIEMLLEIGCDVHAVDQHGYTVIHHSAHAKSVEPLKLLLQKGFDINALNEYGESALHLAISNGNGLIAKAMLLEGADANTVNPTNGWSTIHYAGKGGSVELLRMLLDLGANVNTAAKDGKTALHMACWLGHREAVEYLVESGADINAADEIGSTALYFAADNNGGSGCLSFLVNSGAKASIDQADKDGHRALHFTAKAHRVHETETLLKAGADVYVFTNDGESPLQLAAFGEASRSGLSTVSALCRFGAEWTSSCQDKLARIKAKLKAHEVDATDERCKHFEWCSGLRACILHWEQQYRDDIKVFTKVPMEVIRRGEVSVRTYIADATRSNADELVYRCKVCVVGPSEWGKSSLVRSIETMKPFLVDTKDRTIGIELVATSLRTSDKKEPTKVGLPEPSMQSVGSNTNGERPKHHEVTFWDFAGQDVYSVAHSLFFSRRTVYVLVVDVKAYLDQLDAVKWLRSSASEAAMDRFLSRYVFRWVRTIFARQPDAEFLVLGTKADLLNDEKMESMRVWRDLQSRVYQWKLNYMREIEEEFGVVTKASSKLTGHTVTKDQAIPGVNIARIQELTEKLARLASDKWLVVSITRADSIEAVCQTLQRTIEASERGFPMWNKYSRVQKAMAAKCLASNRPGDGLHRLEHGMMLFRPLCAQLMDEVEGLQYDECRVILRTLHDLGDVIWYENQEAGELRDFIILDPMLVIDIVREGISHEHKKKTSGVYSENRRETEEKPRIDGRVSHSLLETFPLWKHMDKELTYAYKMLLKRFQLAYPADDEEMDPDSDLIVPSYWKAQMEAVTSSGDLSLPGTPQEKGEVVLPNHHCWEYEVSADLAESIFEQFAVQSYTSFMKREVRANCIESSCEEVQSWITLHPGAGKYDVLRVEVASEDPAISWFNMRYYLMKLEKVLDGYSGLAVPRFVVVDGERNSLSPATKAIRDCIMMGRDRGYLRIWMPWLPPDLEWFINRAWRDIAVFQELQMMHLVRDKLNVLQKLVVKSESQRRYPALWTLEYKTEERVVVLRMLSDLTGRCYHVPIEIEVPPAFLAKHGSKLKEGISLLANVLPSSLSAPVIKMAIDSAVSGLEAKSQQATQIHNLIGQMDLTTTTGITVNNLGLSPGGAMAILKDLLKLHNDSLDELSISEICNLECAATSKGEYVWAHAHEISTLKKELTPCQPRFEPDSASTSSEPHQEPQSPTRSPSKLKLSLCIETVTGLTNWDWYKTYCKWQLFYGDCKTPLAAGATATNTSSNAEPSWSSLKMSLEAIHSVEMLQECRLVVRVKRSSRIGWTKIIGEGQVELRSLVSVDDKLAFKCDPIRVTLRSEWLWLHGACRPVPNQQLSRVWQFTTGKMR